MPSDDVFASLDDALQASASKPFIYFAKLAAPVLPSFALREGDKAQALTLRLLEKHRKIMDPSQHDSLHHDYEFLVKERKKIKSGFFRSMKHREGIYQYRNGSLDLNYSTATSSLEARSKVLWKKAKSAPSTTSLTSTIDSTALSGVDSVLNDAESFLSAVDSLLNDDGNSDKSTTCPENDGGSVQSTTVPSPEIESAEIGDQLYTYIARQQTGSVDGDSVLVVVSRLNLHDVAQDGRLEITISPFDDPSEAAAATVAVRRNTV